MSESNADTKTRDGFLWSAELRKHVAARAIPGKWAGVRGLVEDNDRVIHDAGFTLPDGSWQPLPALPTEAHTVPAAVVGLNAPRYSTTEICVANADTLSAALALGDACALNFANAHTPGGRYRSNGLAQEEDLCRLLPQLYPSLKTSSYPIAPGTALVTRSLTAVRRPGTYELCASLGECTIITAAMPCGAADRRPTGGWAGSVWAENVALRIRSVLHAAVHTGHPNLILGAFGCGAFGNPAGPVAAIFKEQLTSPEFSGAFARVVFAIIDPVGTGNLKPFQKELRMIGQFNGSPRLADADCVIQPSPNDACGDGEHAAIQTSEPGLGYDDAKVASYIPEVNADFVRVYHSATSSAAMRARGVVSDSADGAMQWQVLVDGTSWSPYAEDQNEVIVRAVAQQLRCCEIRINTWKYTIELGSKVQRNTKTGKERPIRCRRFGSKMSR